VAEEEDDPADVPLPLNLDAVVTTTIADFLSPPFPVPRGGLFTVRIVVVRWARDASGTIVLLLALDVDG
jgi:hypothetical protein